MKHSGQRLLMKLMKTKKAYQDFQMLAQILETVGLNR